MKKYLFALLTLLLCITASFTTVLADGTFRIDDNADLLTDEEEAALQEKYAQITEYMDTAFVTTNSASGSTASFAERYAINQYGDDPAVFFVIDMDNRNIYVYANGSALKTVTSADSRAITDNIYKYAMAGDYYTCADKAFAQILADLQGERLARPVKHITNAMIAILFAILINYLLTVRSRTPKKVKRTQNLPNELLAARKKKLMAAFTLAVPVLISSVKHYHDNDSDSGGGGGGGGGGHSGGGGGHSF